MIQLSQRGNSPSLAERISAHARQVAADGQSMLYLSVGQPSTGAPKAAMEALKQRSESDILGYTPVMGNLSLRQRIAQSYADEYGVEVSPERIFVTFGASGAFLLLFLGLFDAGAKIALPMPCYFSYMRTMETLGVKPLHLYTQAENRFHPTIEDIERLPEKPDGLIVVSPNNPTGSMIEPERLKALVEYCHQHDITLISDEIYHGIVFNQDIDVATALQYSDDVIVVNSFSKYFSMPGWRVGWMVLPDEEIAAKIACLARNMYVSPNSPSQYLAEKSFDCQDELNQHVERYARNRDILQEGLPKAGFIAESDPDGAFYYYAKIDGLQGDGIEFCLNMIKETGVVATPGHDFDPKRGGQYIRFSYAGATDAMEEAVHRLQRWRG